MLLGKQREEEQIWGSRSRQPLGKGACWWCPIADGRTSEILQSEGGKEKASLEISFWVRLGRKNSNLRAGHTLF